MQIVDDCDVEGAVDYWWRLAVHIGGTPENGMAEDSQGVIYAPDAPTCGERVLDYFVVSEGFAQSWAIVATCVVGDAFVRTSQPGPLDCQGQHSDGPCQTTQGSCCF